jgi:formylglycine-generating enzyme required for sulfatase activity
MTRKLKVFLCHASQDKPAVRELYNRLKSEPWIDPWLDEESLLPGQDFDLAIYKAMRDADAIVICLSKVSVTKEGYVNKEIRRALDAAQEKTEGAIYVIPLRLDECNPSFEALRKLHWVDYFTPNAHEKLIKGLRVRAEALKIEATEVFKTSVASAVAPALDLYLPPEYSPNTFTPPPATVPSWTFGGMEFVKVTRGKFLMGSSDKDQQAFGEEKPQHTLDIPYDFLIARFPVTNEQFAIFAKETKLKDDWGDDPFNKLKHPVVNVTWKTSSVFCDWMTQKYKNESPRGVVFRLPTEAEWEKSARGTDGRIYPWGNEFDLSKCNSYESGIGTTTPVGAFSPQGDSPYGVCDLSGNVWEWTASLWGKNLGEPEFKYPYNPRDGRENLKVGDDVFRVQRGGSFHDESRLVRSAVRLRAFWNLIDGGFRVALAPNLS